MKNGLVWANKYLAEFKEYHLLFGDGLTSLYAQCRSVDVTEGDTVRAGEQIAAVGSTGKSTGPHLHFEVRQDGTAQNPTVYFDAETRATLRMG